MSQFGAVAIKMPSSTVIQTDLKVIGRLVISVAPSRKSQRATGLRDQLARLRVEVNIAPASWHRAVSKKAHKMYGTVIHDPAPTRCSLKKLVFVCCFFLLSVVQKLAVRILACEIAVAILIGFVRRIIGVEFGFGISRNQFAVAIF